MHVTRTVPGGVRVNTRYLVSLSSSLPGSVDSDAAYQRERRIAARFQSALLPRGEVRLPGYALAHIYHPAMDDADVGGDFYNLFAIDERRVAIAIGAVAGKGLAAAVVAARIQHAWSRRR